MRRLAIPALAALLLAACGGAGLAPLADAAGAASAEWVALDLADGRVVPVAGAADPSRPEWRGSRILFRQVQAGGGRVGKPLADIVAEDDEHPVRQVGHERLWIAALELTQAQWLAMTGTRPWMPLLPVLAAAPWVGDDLPAFGMTPRQAERALASWSRDGWQLDLPDADEWEVLCLAGGGKRFAWGDDLDPGTAALHAVCDADGALPPTPRTVGGRLANALGLHDMHGNAWELVRDGVRWQARGGSWDQPPVACRASNRIAIADADQAGWAVGMRLVLRR